MLILPILGSSPVLSCPPRPRALTTLESPDETTNSNFPIRKNNDARAASELNISQQRPEDLGLLNDNLSRISTSMAFEDLLMVDAQHLANPSVISPAQLYSGSRSHSNSDKELKLRPNGLKDEKPMVLTAWSTGFSSSVKCDPPAEIATSLLEIFHDHRQQAQDLVVSSTATGGQSIPTSDSKESGVLFDELVDRLLSPPMSKSDSRFVSIFLCLYRKFAAPLKLVSAILRRFDELNESYHPQFFRITAQLRYLSILEKWVSDYPGDFAHHLTRQNMANFVTGLGSTRIFAVASKEMKSFLDVVLEDDDTGWACSDSSNNRLNAVESFPSISSICSTALDLNAHSSTINVSREHDVNKLILNGSARNSAALSISSSAGRSESQSTGSFQTLLNSIDNAQRQAQQLTPVPKISLTKIQWHQLMETSEEEIARELTRIDWIMFSSIRPRDFVRHVSLTTDQKKQCKSLENVNRMISHFNHIAFWVANLVLLRDKPKHRAKALEKFMTVAWVS